MLFDLRTGKRRRVIQVVFGFLAFIFVISFVGFGIGSDVQGGIFDALGVGGSGGGSTSTQYEQQIEEAEEKLATNPNNQKALEDLARYRYLSGQESLEVTDEQAGAVAITEDTRTEWNAALDAWERFLDSDPKKVDPLVAGQMVCAYAPIVCGTQASTEALDLAGAAETQALLARQDGSAQAYGQLAAFYYADGNVKKGDEAREEALETAPEGQRKQLETQLDRLRRDAERFVKQQQQAEQGGGGGDPQLQNPFGGLGSDSGAGGLQPVTP